MEAFKQTGFCLHSNMLTKYIIHILEVYKHVECISNLVKHLLFVYIAMCNSLCLFLKLCCAVCNCCLFTLCWYSACVHLLWCSTRQKQIKIQSNITLQKTLLVKKKHDIPLNLLGFFFAISNFHQKIWYRNIFNVKDIFMNKFYKYMNTVDCLSITCICVSSIITVGRTND